MITQTHKVDWNIKNIIKNDATMFALNGLNLATSIRVASYFDSLSLSHHVKIDCLLWKINKLLFPA